MTNREQILELFNQRNGIVKLREITKLGINKYHLLKLVKSGDVERLQHGLYKLVEHHAHELIEINRIIPNGIVCLYSAWNYYNLTTYIPHEYHVAIERKTKIKLPDYPPIKLYYWNISSFSVGINKQIIDDATVNIYDIEKSVCDAVKFRNKIGKDILNEVISNYLKRRDRNINKLIEYSKLLRINTILNNYLEVLL